MRPGMLKTVAMTLGVLALVPRVALAETPAAASAASVGDGSPFVYQRSAEGRAGAVTAILETGYGTRETRNFAQDGVEQSLRLRYRPTERLSVEAFGGTLLEQEARSYGVEANYRLLRATSIWPNVDAGLGFTHDYRGDDIPRVRVAAGREVGRLGWGVTGTFEVPVGNPERDELDIMLATAATWSLSRELRIGVELAGEDLEGLVEDEEAEGGAKLLAGPTLRAELGERLFVQLNSSVVYAQTANQVFAPGVRRPDTWGFSSRALLGWTLR